MTGHYIKFSDEDIDVVVFVDHIQMVTTGVRPAIARLNLPAASGVYIYLVERYHFAPGATIDEILNLISGAGDM